MELVSLAVLSDFVSWNPTPFLSNHVYHVLTSTATSPSFPMNESTSAEGPPGGDIPCKPKVEYV